MNVVLLATSYPSSPDDPAGHFVRAEALSLVREGHDVCVLAPAPFAADRGVKTIACGGHDLFQWPGAVTRLRQSPIRLFSASEFVATAIEKLPLCVDRIIAHWAVPCAWPIVAFATKGESNLPSVEVVCHGADIRLLCALPSLVRHRLLEQILVLRPKIRFASSDLLETLVNYVPSDLAKEIEACSFTQMPMVDVTHVNQPVSGVSPFVVSAGRLIASKRVDLAIETIAKCPSFDLVVLGDGPERHNLEQLANQRAPGRVRFLGIVPRPQALGWIRDAHALLHLSEVDASPTVILEARSLGTPVVAAAVGEVHRWAQKDQGVVLVERTAVDAASALSTTRRCNALTTND